MRSTRRSSRSAARRWSPSAAAALRPRRAGPRPDRAGPRVRSGQRLEGGAPADQEEAEHGGGHQHEAEGDALSADRAQQHAADQGAQPDDDAGGPDRPAVESPYGAQSFAA